MSFFQCRRTKNHLNHESLVKTAVVERRFCAVVLSYRSSVWLKDLS